MTRRRFNSVDGSTRLTALLGWHRFACSNGLIVGKTLAQYRRLHDRRLSTRDLGTILRKGLKAAERERKTFDRWTREGIDQELFTKWIDQDLRKAWGPKAAARAYVIATTGHDAVFPDPFEGGAPSERSWKPGPPVPGSIVPATTRFAMSQVLSWLSSQRPELPDRIKWTAQVPSLVEALTLLRAN